MKRDGLDNVRTEKVMVPHWVRGQERQLIEPVERPSSCSASATVSHAAAGITRRVVVRNFTELDLLGER